MIVSPPKSGLKHNTALWLASLCHLLLCLCVRSWPSPHLRLYPTPLPVGPTLPLKVLAPLLPDGGRTLRLRSWCLSPSHCPLPQLSCVTAHTEDFKLKAVILTFPGAPGALKRHRRKCRTFTSKCILFLPKLSSLSPLDPAVATDTTVSRTQTRGSERVNSLLFSGVCSDFHHRPLGGSPAHG